MIIDIDETKLIRRAYAAREKAYAPYSGFFVGAALLSRTGKIYAGCNIENAAFSPTNCAERSAFFRAVSAGERRFAAIAVVGGPRGTKAGEFSYCFPCGVCRQVMREFCSDDFLILAAINPQECRKFSLRELLPEAFGPDDLPLR